MQVSGRHYRTIWTEENTPGVVKIIDQRALPHRFAIEDIRTVGEMATAIRDMHVRGAGLIGASAGYGMFLATIEAGKSGNFDKLLRKSAQLLKSTRPTAINLQWAVDRQIEAISMVEGIERKILAARDTAVQIAGEDAACCQQIGRHGRRLIEKISQEKGGNPVNILTHCNAGWLAFVDYGSATAPIYAAHDSGIPVHVWVDETRPRNQGAALTAWELGQHGVPHTLIVDNAGGHLMQHGKVDLVFVGTDRTTCTGDVANKIGTYLKALAANDNNVPFYAALPSSTFDWGTKDGLKDIPIEERDSSEIKYVTGMSDGSETSVLISPEDCKAANFAFDVTPARLVSGLITERGICSANEKSIRALYPEF